MSLSSTTLPELVSDYPILPDQTKVYQKTGHIFLPHVASREEVAAYRQVILDTVARKTSEVLPLEQRGTYGKAFSASRKHVAGR